MTHSAGIRRWSGPALTPGHATAVAVGSHEPDAREVDTTLVRRSNLVVESRPAALRDAGGLLIPIAERAATPGHIARTRAEVVTGRVALPADRPRLFQSVCTAWQDPAAAAAH